MWNVSCTRHRGMGHGGSWSIAPLILILGHPHVLAVLFPRNCHQHPFSGGLGGSQSRSRCWEDGKALATIGSRTAACIVQPVFRSHCAVLFHDSFLPYLTSVRTWTVSQTGLHSLLSMQCSDAPTAVYCYGPSGLTAMSAPVPTANY
jgi:hypothetical protein